MLTFNLQILIINCFLTDLPEGNEVKECQFNLAMEDLQKRFAEETEKLRKRAESAENAAINARVEASLNRGTNFLERARAATQMAPSAGERKLSELAKDVKSFIKERDPQLIKEHQKLFGYRRRDVIPCMHYNMRKCSYRGAASLEHSGGKNRSVYHFCIVCRKLNVLALHPAHECPMLLQIQKEQEKEPESCNKS